MNACYRLGGEDNVAALAKFAGADHPNKLRLEAIEMLGAWAEPDARDRVINDWRPIEPRAAAPAIAALKQALPTILNGPTKIQEAATKVATQYGITEIVPTLLKQVKEAKEPGLRGSALRALAKLDATQAKALIPSALKDKAVEVRVAALEATVSVDPKTATTILVEHTRSEATAERQKAWQLLGQLKKQDEAKQALQQGVKAYLADELPNDVWLDVLQASDTVLSDELRQQLKQQEQQWTEKDPLDAWRWAVAGGNVEAGRNIFLYKTEVSCVRCHKVGKQGGEVGPELTELGAKRDAKYLLEAVVLPNAKIAEGFETVVLVDDLGAVHTGVLRGETDAYVEIITADGATKRIEKETIEARRKGNSAMPADLEKHLKREDLRDLVAYLVSLRGGNAKPAGHE